MKYFKTIFIFFLILSLHCASGKFINGVYYKPYGLLSRERENKNVEYKKKKSSVFVGIIFIETGIIPVISWGYRLYEPDTIRGLK